MATLTPDEFVAHLRANRAIPRWEDDPYAEAIAREVVRDVMIGKSFAGRGVYRQEMAGLLVRYSEQYRQGDDDDHNHNHG